MTAKKIVAPAQDVSADLVGPDGTSASGAPAAAPAAPAASVAPVDAPEALQAPEARAARLTALLNGEAAEAPEAEPAELDYDPAQKPVDFGGRTVCVVTFGRWNALVDGLFRSARKGGLIRVTAEQADRGEAMGGLRRVDLD